MATTTDERDKFLDALSKAGLRLDPTAAAAPPPSAPPGPSDALIHKIGAINSASPDYGISDAPGKKSMDLGVLGASGGLSSLPQGVGAPLPAAPQAAAPNNLVFAPKMAAPKPSGPGVDPLAPYWAAKQSEIGAVGEQATAQQHINDDASVEAAQKGQALGDQQADVMRTAETQDKEAQERIGKIDQLSKDVADQKIDPDRWFHNQSLLSKGGWFLAAALQGFNAGRSGGTNQAITQMNHERDLDIDAQAKAIESKKGRIGDMKGLLAETYRRFGNMNEAKSAARIMSMQQLDQQTQAYAAGSQNEMVRANADKMSAELRAQIAREKAMLSMKSAPAIPKGLDDYGKRVAESGITDIAPELQTLQGIANQKDPAGFGLVARGAHAVGADWAMTQEGRDNRAALERVVLNIAKATGRVNENEVNMVRNMALGALENPAGLKNFSNWVGGEMQARARNIQASTDPRVAAAYQALGGQDIGAVGQAPPPVRGFKPVGQ